MIVISVPPFGSAVRWTVPLTPEGCRYADMDVAPDGTWLVAVREDHRGEGEANNEIVRIDTATGEETVLVTGPDFVASPRVSPSGEELAWTQWNHPDMPWDAAEVWVSGVDHDELPGPASARGGVRVSDLTGPQRGRPGLGLRLGDLTEASSRSTAASMSSRQVSAVRRSSRRRG